MSLSAMNQLQKMLARHGQTLVQAVEFDNHQHASGQWESAVTIHAEFCPEVITGTGKDPRKSQAKIKAVKVALEKLSDVGTDWSRTKRHAQAGDALIKLAAYLAEELHSAEEASGWLQAHENDAALAAVFDRWQTEGVEEFSKYGSGLGTKSKATLVEALIWRQYGATVLGPDATKALAEIRLLAQGDRSPVGQ